jgi:hypothetical protein
MEVAVVQDALHERPEGGVSYAICGATFWITHPRRRWAVDDCDYSWRVLTFGRVVVAISKTAAGRLQLRVDGACPDGRPASISVACPAPAMAPNGRAGVLVSLEWEPQSVSVSLQDRLVAEHHFALH